MLSSAFIVLGMVFGAVFASAAHCFISRDSGWLQGRSVCDGCKRPLRWWQLIPVLGFVFQRGRSVCCDHVIHGRHLIFELLGAVVFGMVAWQLALHGLTLESVVLSMSCLVLFYTFMLDESRHLISLPWLGFGVVVVLIVRALQGELLPAIFAALVGLSFFGLQWFITRGKAIGSGDMWLGAFMGLIFLFPEVLLVILFGYVIGSLHALVLLAFQRANRKTPVPLGAYLSFASLIVLLGDVSLTDWTPFGW